MKIDELTDYLANLDEVKRHEELSVGINNNKVLKEKYEHLKECQKELVRNNNEIGKTEYQNALDDFLSCPFMEEYLELTEYLNNILGLVTNEINMNINKE